MVARACWARYQYLVLPLVHSATDAGCCAFSSPLSRVVAVATCAGHWRPVRQPWLGFPLGQALLCSQGLPIPGVSPRARRGHVHAQARCACEGLWPSPWPSGGEGHTPHSLQFLQPGSCHGDQQPFPINPWRKEAFLRGSDCDKGEPPLRGGLKAVKETSELRRAQHPLTSLLIFLFPLSAPSPHTHPWHFSGGPEARPSSLSQSWQTPRGGTSL